MSERVGTSLLGPDDVRTVGVVGAGAIGASWTALVLARGLRVVVADPDPATRDRLHDHVAALLSGLDVADPGPLLSAGLILTDDLSAVAATDLVLEGGPERLEVKREIFAELDATARPEVLLTSSSSGLTPTSFQDACTHHPERVLVVHPFNPPHLVPLVEVVAGTQTSEAAVQVAMRIFRHLGKHPIRLRRELPGHVANRLQAALWREAYHLVDIGAVSVADIDIAIASGPGLRWALLGPFATQHLSGGPGGIAHVLEHLGPPMVDWWADLGRPELTPDLVDRLVAGVAAELDEELGGESAAALTARRDDALRALMALKADRGL